MPSQGSTGPPPPPTLLDQGCHKDNRGLFIPRAELVVGRGGGGWLSCVMVGSVGQSDIAVEI